MPKRLKLKWPSSTEKRPWSDLPEELMESVMAKVLFTDQVCVHAVCKRWRSLRFIQPPKQIPWLLIWRNRSLASCELYDPVNKKNFPIDSTGLRDFPNARTILWASKHGWLLISYSWRLSLFLLYNPFTREKIQFPLLDNAYNIPTFTATFSSRPSSPDCIIFTAMYNKKNSKNLIRTCRVGESTWNSSSFDCEESFNVFSNVVYMDGLFYCLGSRGILATFNTAQQTWAVLEVRGTLCHILGDVCCASLEECGGELFLILPHINHEFKYNCRLDRSKMTWELVDSFGDLLFFMGPNYALVSDSATKKGIGNRIYYVDYHKPKYYPMNCPRRFADCHVYNWINTEGCEMSLSFFKDRCNMAFVEPTV